MRHKQTRNRKVPPTPRDSYIIPPKAPEDWPLGQPTAGDNSRAVAYLFLIALIVAVGVAVAFTELV